MRKIWSLLLIFISLTLSAEGIFSACVAHACTDDQYEFSNSSEIASHQAIDQINAPSSDGACSPDGHPCHIGHCPALLSLGLTKVVKNIVLGSGLSMPKELYLSPDQLSFLRPPASLSA